MTAPDGYEAFSMGPWDLITKDHDTDHHAERRHVEDKIKASIIVFASMLIDWDSFNRQKADDQARRVQAREAYIMGRLRDGVATHLVRATHGEFSNIQRHEAEAVLKKDPLYKGSHLRWLQEQGIQHRGPAEWFA